VVETEAWPAILWRVTRSTPAREATTSGARKVSHECFDSGSLPALRGHHHQLRLRAHGRLRERGLIADEEVFEVAIEEAITDEMVADFADGAREGGSTYWCDELFCLRTPDRPLTYFGENLAAGAWYGAAEYDDDPRQRDWHPLDATRMRAGISRAAQHFNQPIDVPYEEHDAGDADVAFQYAVLGKVIYN
jgi:hypothetical protein